MAEPWAADVELSAADAGRLIARQFPPLAGARVEPFGVGWDNAAFLVDGRLVFRFPRRQFAAGFIAREAQVLPLLAPHLPLPIPVPTFAGEPDDGYPYPWAGYALLPGTTACRVAWSEEERAGCAVPLARFLAALHRIPVDPETAAWAPGDDIGRADFAKRVPMVQERLSAVAPTLQGRVVVEPLLELVDRLAPTPPMAGPPCWVHGDLYARHLLVDEERRPCGVIDWGDVHLGDPALDLSLAFGFLAPSARDTFRDAYGPIDDTTWDRARFRALFYGAVLTEYGAATGDDPIRAAGEYALRAAAV